ncbi:unnamed protein product [Paramecium octaurelia]|uniref:TLDc domain-containing protein n=1 Tax=Paramecium octaurelia TaxID=43137 RepID=A0A8S1YIQ8_PAROT|nr:unnamed protein product [Paramecium octaurelia]
MAFQSKSDYIFGAYSPCKWESDKGHVKDNTLSSFIFSQTHDQVYPLKSSYQSEAIYCHSSYGPTFGSSYCQFIKSGHDIQISSNFTDGYSNLGHSYEFNQYKNGNGDPYLFGQNQPQIKECEIYVDFGIK